MGRDSSVGIATRYWLHGPGIKSRGGGGAIFSESVRTGPGAHPGSCTMGTESALGVKRPGRGADHPPPSKCRGHEGVELYLYSLAGPSWPVIGKTFTFTFTVIDICVEKIWLHCVMFGNCSPYRHMWKKQAQARILVATL